MAYEAIASRENYVQNIQDTAVGILRNKNATNILITLQNMLLSIRNSNAETRGKLDGLLNYLIRVFGNAMTRTELAAANRNSGSAMFLLFTEHREDAYLSNTYVIQNGLFEESRNFTYVMVRDPDTGETEKDPEYKLYYMERIGNVSVAAVP